MHLEVLKAAEAEIPTSAEADAYVLREEGAHRAEWDTAARRFVTCNGDIVRRASAALANEEAAVRDRYGKAITSFHLLRMLSRAAAETMETVRGGLGSDDASDPVHEALGRLYWMGYLVASEVAVLLSGGYAAGADARWRTLHELYVRALVIFEAGSEVAEALILHEGMRERRREASWEGRDSVGRGLADTALEKRFGGVFFTDYGWAHDYLRSSYSSYRELCEKHKRDRGPNFLDLSRKVSRDDPAHRRGGELFYNDANAAVHGAHSSAAEAELRAGPPKPRAGPSLQGLPDVARRTCVAFANLSEMYVGQNQDDLRMNRLRILIRAVAGVVEDEWEEAEWYDGDENS